MTARRALLYMPGDDIHKIIKSLESGVDSICMDLEDGVALNNKNKGRKTVLNALITLQFSKIEKLVRINPVNSEFVLDDLKSILDGKPDGIIIPKVTSQKEVIWVSDQIWKFEKNNNIRRNSIRLLIIIETALGVINLPQIASSDPRIDGLIFGAEDLVGEIGAIRTPEAIEVLYARSAVLLNAIANNIQPIDMVFLNFKDSDGLKKECIQGLQMGFTGKQIIHPDQIQIVQDIYTPSAEMIFQAQKLIEAYKKHEDLGIGAFALEGKLVDAPVIKAAIRVIDRAREIGAIQ